MQAIQTSFISPTNTRGDRIKAECWAKKIIISWNFSLNQEENHKVACQKLMDILGWDNKFSSGQLRDGSYVHVLEWTK